MSAVVAGLKGPDAASSSHAPHHPPLYLNLLLSFTMKSTSCNVPGTVAAGNVSNFFGFQWIFAILEPSGKGLPLRGTPAPSALIITGLASIDASSAPT